MSRSGHVAFTALPAARRRRRSDPLHSAPTSRGKLCDAVRHHDRSADRQACRETVLCRRLDFQPGVSARVRHEPERRARHVLVEPATGTAAEARRGIDRPYLQRLPTQPLGRASIGWTARGVVGIPRCHQDLPRGDADCYSQLGQQAISPFRPIATLQRRPRELDQCCPAHQPRRGFTGTPETASAIARNGGAEPATHLPACRDATSSARLASRWPRPGWRRRRPRRDPCSSGTSGSSTGAPAACSRAGACLVEDDRIKDDRRGQPGRARRRARDRGRRACPDARADRRALACACCAALPLAGADDGRSRPTSIWSPPPRRRRHLDARLHVGARPRRAGLS